MACSDSETKLPFGEYLHFSFYTINLKTEKHIMGIQRLSLLLTDTSQSLLS